MLAAGVPVTVAVGAVDVVENAAGGAVAAFSSRGLALGGGLKPDLVAAGVAVPTSEPGRGEEGEVRFGTVSGTSVAAAVVAGTAAVLAQGRPRVGAEGLKSLLTGSAQRRDLDLDALASGAGLVDVRAAVQQEIVTNPVSLSFGVPLRRSLELERTLRVRNVSTRPLEISIQSAALASRGVEISIDPRTARAAAPGVAPTSSSEPIRPRSFRSGRARRPESSSSSSRAPRRCTSRGPWRCPRRRPTCSAASRSKPTAGRVSDATPAVLELVAGALTTTPGLQVRPLDVLEVQLRRGGELLGRAREAPGDSPRPVHVRPHRARSRRGPAEPRELHGPGRRASRLRPPAAGRGGHVPGPVEAYTRPRPI